MILLSLAKFESVQEWPSCVIICTIHLLGRYLLVSGAFSSLCNIILSTTVCCSVFLISYAVTFAPPGSEKSSCRRDFKGSRENRILRLHSPVVFGVNLTLLKA